MQINGSGQPVNSAWSIPGTQHVEAPATGPARMSLNGKVVGQRDHGRPEQTWKQPQPAAPRTNTISEQIYQGIVNVNQHPERAQDLAVYETLADQLVQQKQAEVDAGTTVLRTALTPEAQTAAQRTWQRDRQVLDALASEGEKAHAITETIKSAANDPARLAVLAEEAPSYLRAAGVDPGFLDNVFAQVVPGQAERVATRDKAIQERTTLKHAVQMVRKGIGTGKPAVALDKLAPAISRLDPDRR
jgi:hypothetical protein